jgi:hypothetical protein
MIARHEMGSDDEIEELARAIVAICDDTTDRRSLEALRRIAGRWQTPRVPVVVAGEVSTGKTTLINALIGERLLPADAAPTTSAAVRVHYAPRRDATVTVTSEGKTSIEPLDPIDFALYLTRGGTQKIEKRHGRGARVVRAELGLPVPLLAGGLELLDTPGAGGLELAHRHVALAGLVDADAVIFVTRAGEPMSATERLFLAEAVERVARCVVVITHLDQLPDADEVVTDARAMLADRNQWEKLLDDPERADILAARFRSVPTVAVSPANRLDALDLGPDRMQQHVERGSNIAALEELLQKEIIDHTDELHRQNVILLCRRLARDVADMARTRRSLLTGDESAAVALAERSDAIKHWTAHGGQHWQADFEEDCNRIGPVIEQFARKRSDELNNTYRVGFRAMSTKQVTLTVEALRDEPTSVLTEMLLLARTHIAGAVSRVRGLLAEDHLDGPLEALIATRDVESRLVIDGPAEVKVKPGFTELRAGAAGVAAGIGLANVGAHGLVYLGLMAAGPVPIFWPIVLGAAAFSGYEFWRRSVQVSAERAIVHLDEVRRCLVGEVVALAKGACADAAVLMRTEIAAALTDLEVQVIRDREALGEAADLAGRPEERARRLSELERIADEADRLGRVAADIASRG